MSIIDDIISSLPQPVQEWLGVERPAVSGIDPEITIGGGDSVSHYGEHDGHFSMMTGLRPRIEHPVLSTRPSISSGDDAGGGGGPYRRGEPGDPRLIRLADAVVTAIPEEYRGEMRQVRDRLAALNLSQPGSREALGEIVSTINDIVARAWPASEAEMARVRITSWSPGAARCVDLLLAIGEARNALPTPRTDSSQPRRPDHFFLGEPGSTGTMTPEVASEVNRLRQLFASAAYDPSMNVEGSNPLQLLTIMIEERSRSVTREGADPAIVRPELARLRSLRELITQESYRRTVLYHSNPQADGWFEQLLELYATEGFPVAELGHIIVSFPITIDREAISQRVREELPLELRECASELTDSILAAWRELPASELAEMWGSESVRSGEVAPSFIQAHVEEFRERTERTTVPERPGRMAEERRVERRDDILERAREIARRGR